MDSSARFPLRGFLRRSRPAWVRWAAVLALVMLLALPGLFLVAPAARADLCSNALPNGGFENPDGWAVQSAGSYAVISDFWARSGQYSAYLAGVDNASDRLTATVSLPQVDSITLSFWWLMQTEESGTGSDGLTVQVADTNGNPLQVLATVSDASVSGVWQQASADLTAYAGQTVQIQFLAQTDDTLSTDFYVDDVEASACTATDETFWLFLPITRR